ncbi:MAG: hypothetical protein LQ348_006477 [Seirophora lacunosa]|nr:MAG: hypothetical protein LQ348_006477 [Seirophora lacunosa]
MASAPSFDTQSADQRVKTLVNAQLKIILKKEKLAVSGLKAAMQHRIISRKDESQLDPAEAMKLHDYAKNQDLERFERLKGFINNPEALQLSASSLPSDHNSYHELHSVTGKKTARPPVMPSGNPASFKPVFKESPFYTVLESLTDVYECKVREGTRDQVDCKITLRPDVADQITTDSSIRTMIFCASEPISHFAKVDIAFPHQVEIKVNMDEVKANLRGLKNKSGSTRPPDITALLRKRANYENLLSLTYALTHKIWEDDIKGSVVAKAQDSDVEATGANVSLKCPLSTLRIEIPCRSTVCMHNQCFDATYIDDILRATPKSVDQVMVGRDGKWSLIAEGDLSLGGSRASSEDDADLVEIKDPPRLSSVKNVTNNSLSFMRTPPASSREQSSSSVPPPSTGVKRSSSAVIDLTSDDDDEDHWRSSKRPTMPLYPANLGYDQSKNIRPSSGAVSSAPSRSYMTNPLSKPEYVQGALRNQQGGKLANHIGSKELQASSLLMAGGFVPVVDLKGLNTEMVPLAQQVAAELSARRKGSSKTFDEEEQREAALQRLDKLGYRVGQGLLERFSRDRPRFADMLDMIKFLCKDLWTLVFRKQIDNLKTNHRGVYVLTDNAFRPFARMGMSSRKEAVVKAQPFLSFPCGVIRGALENMGVNVTVQAETSELPGATFQIKTLGGKG